MAIILESFKCYNQDRWQDRGRFCVLTNMCIGNKRTVPLSPVECGFMGGDIKYCRDNSDRIANAIFCGISNYLPINTNGKKQISKI